MVSRSIIVIKSLFLQSSKNIFVTQFPDSFSQMIKGLLEKQQVRSRTKMTSKPSCCFQNTLTFVFVLPPPMSRLAGPLFATTGAAKRVPQRNAVSDWIVRTELHVVVN